VSDLLERISPEQRRQLRERLDALAVEVEKLTAERQSEDVWDDLARRITSVYGSPARARAACTRHGRRESRRSRRVGHARRVESRAGPDDGPDGEPARGRHYGLTLAAGGVS
jgi:hypothetical protein